MAVDEIRIRVEELIILVPRVPVALCLDISGSMAGKPLEELRQGVLEFYSACQSDTMASQSAEIVVITFSSSASVLAPFRAVANVEAPSIPNASGTTNLAAGVCLALEQLRLAKEQYQQNSTDYFQPWLVLMTAGAPNDNSYLSQAAEVVALETDGKLCVFPIGIGEGADPTVLSKFSNKKSPMKLQGINFQAFFEWLAKSISKVSQSRPGERVSLPDVKDWAEKGWERA